MTERSTVFVFDLDGVITDPIKTEVNVDLLRHIHDLLAQQTLVGINTGRSYDWVKKNLVKYLEDQNNPELFKHLVVVCEKGGEMIKYESGEAILTPSRFALAETDYRKTKDVFDAHSADLKTMFWDDTKRTMATLEKFPDAAIDDFHREQQVLLGHLKSALGSSDVRIEPTISAIDVEHPDAGKYSGAEIIYDWVKTQAADANTFICFGDSISDYNMAHCFADHSATTTFVYVGKKPEDIQVDPRVEDVFPEKKFDQGTLEYLENLMTRN